MAAGRRGMRHHGRRPRYARMPRMQPGADLTENQADDQADKAPPKGRNQRARIGMAALPGAVPIRGRESHRQLPGGVVIQSDIEQKTLTRGSPQIPASRPRCAGRRAPAPGPASSRGPGRPAPACALRIGHADVGIEAAGRGRDSVRLHGGIGRQAVGRAIIGHRRLDAVRQLLAGRPEVGARGAGPS